MWWQIYDKLGQPVPGATNTFIKEISGDHQPITKVEFLNTDFVPIGANLWSDPKGQVQNVVSDGNVDVDVDRGTRRTAELTLLNPSGEFTPTTRGMDPAGWWSGKVYLNRVIRVWRGIKMGDLEWYVPIGTFLVDNAEVIVEENMSLVNLTMSDFWKKLHKSTFHYQKKYDKGTHYYKIVKDMLESSGIPQSRYQLDTLQYRDAEDKKIQRNMKFKIGDSRGEKLLELRDKWDIDFYFDPLGIFKSDDRTKAKDKAQKWTFAPRPVSHGQSGGLISVTRTFNDDQIYNHVVVIGTGNEKKVIKVNRVDTADWSKLNIERIGRRTKVLETDRISNLKQANRTLNRLWDKRFRINETISAEVICVPLLEADDVVWIEERDHAKVAGRYRLRRFNVPLVTSKQSIEAENVLRTHDF